MNHLKEKIEEERGKLPHLERVHPIFVLHLQNVNVVDVMLLPHSDQYARRECKPNLRKHKPQERPQLKHFSDIINLRTIACSCVSWLKVEDKE